MYTKNYFLYVRFKFKHEDKVMYKLVSRDVFEEMKNVSQIEYCEIMNWHGQIGL